MQVVLLYLYGLVLVEVVWGHDGGNMRWLSVLKTLQGEFRMTESIVL